MKKSNLLHGEISSQHMTSVDICIISDAKTEDLRTITQKCLDTLSISETNVDFKIFIVESNSSISYPEAFMITPTPPFGYNKYQNLAVSQGSSQYVCLCNNDITFEKNWASAIIEEMIKDPELLSATPFCPQEPRMKKSPAVQYGYDLRKTVAPWCTFQQRKIYDITGPLDEDLIFWYCDNSYMEQLKKHKLKQALVTSSVVNHHNKNLGKTAMLLDNTIKKQFTLGQQPIFNKKYK